MRRTKMIWPCLLAALAIGGLAAAAASAITPEFLHEGKEVTNKGFLVKSKVGVTLIEFAGTKYKISCNSSTAEGKIKGRTEVEGVVGKFKECRAKEAEESMECEVKSTSPPGGKEEIITKTLKGRLGVVAKSEAASETGLLLEPAVGTIYVTIKGSKECLPSETSEVKGGLIGEVTPTKTLKLKGELIYKSKAGTSQEIKKFTGESGTHELELFEVKTPLESNDTIEFSETVEVT
jgi:hypothetical protein